MQKLLTFFSKNISIYAKFNDQSFNDTLTNDIVSFEQLGPDDIFLFSPENRFDISCKLSPKETICMKCQNLFSGKNKK